MSDKKEEEVVDPNNIDLDIEDDNNTNTNSQRDNNMILNEKSDDKTDETRNAERVLTTPESEDEYTTIFNGLTKDKEDKFLTNVEFEDAVHMKFGQKVNTELAKLISELNSNSQNNNMKMEQFKEKMEYFEKLSKEEPAASDTKEEPAASDTKGEPAASDTKEEPAASDTKEEPAASDTKASTAAAPATTDNTAYAIIQIDAAQKITVLDAIPDGQTLNTTESPYDLLAKKTPSVFAVKIVKKDICGVADDNVKCIDFDNSHYELDLKTAVMAVGNLLNQEFLNASTGTASSDESSVTASTETATLDASNKDATLDASNKDASSDESTEIKNSGGSRKNRGQKSKKTKRKYYVYRK